MNTWVGVALGALVLFGCSPTPPNPFPRIGVPLVDGVPDLSAVGITLERTGCMLACPRYTLQIEGTGLVTYTGLGNVRSKGERTAHLDRATTLALLEQFEALDFMQPEHECDYWVSDLPIPTVRLRVAANERAFTELSAGTCASDTDDHARVHRAVIALMAAIDDACRVEQWIGSAEDRRLNEDAYR